jgi:outer membrane protein TolC
LLTAQDTQAQVQLARLSALVDLYQALGGGWDTQQEQMQ